MAYKRSGIVGYVFIAFLVGLFGLLLYDLLFTAPDHQQGTVIEKIHIPAHSVSGGTPVGGVRRGNYFITAQQEAQWIALVRMENGEILKVHCLPGHYQTKNIGDVIHFKKYEGKLLHIEYFAHNEEE